jgi:hypothetical protein
MIHYTSTAGLLALRAMLLAAAAAVVVIVTTIGIAAADWIDRPFPGFFVLENRVIPSIGLPHWSASRAGGLYQLAVVAIDGAAITDGAGVYETVASRPTGTPLVYGLRGGAASDAVAVGSQIFTRADYWAIFGTYLGTGFLYLMVGLLGVWLFPETHLGRALLCMGGIGGIYALSAVGVYGPSFGLRLHALAEASLPAAFVYLTLVFARARRTVSLPVLWVGCALSGALAILYQLVLSQPGAYSAVHGACETYLGAAGLGLMGYLLVQRARGTSEPLLHAAAVGAVLGIGVPAVVLLLSGVSGGRVPVNLCTVTAFLFPLSVGWGLVREYVVRAHPVLATTGSGA